MIDINPETRSGAWTSDLVNEANLKYKDSLPAPIVIISYKRGGNASSIKLLKDTNLKVFLFVYDDDYENYKEAVESSNNIEVILCPSKEFRGAAKKWKDFRKEKYPIKANSTVNTGTTSVVRLECSPMDSVVRGK